MHRNDLSVVCTEQLTPRLSEVTLQTSSLATPVDFPLGSNESGQTKVRILLPPGYDTRTDALYPVLYLLHGGTENYSTWTKYDTEGRAEEITRDADLIVVMPDGGVAGGYSDWYNGGVYGAPRWATYHLDELVTWVDSTFRTIARRSGRAIAGLSMGGAAVRYAAQRPDLFAAAASFSGDIDLLQPGNEWRNAGRFVANLIWGDPEQQELRWRGVNGPDLAENLSNTDIALYTGDTGKPESTFILAAAETMRDRLKALGIPHTFTLYPGMGHEWETFNRAFADWLPRLSKALNASADKPDNFEYRTINGEFEVYGWTVKVNNSEPAFVHFAVHSDEAFSLHGVGDAVVHTPASSGRSCQRAAVRISTSGRVVTSDLTADDEGRLSVPFTLSEAGTFVTVAWS